jgi:AraC-like DNA-binding protein
MELTRRPHNAAMLRKHFGCEIMFDRPQDLLVFKAAVLDLPFRTHNVELLEHMVPGLESALHKREAKASLIEQAKESISRSMCGQRPSIHSVAKELCVSARTLQRRLEEEGTTYQSPLDDVRRSTARRLLVSTDLQAGEIAFLLGFEELNSFTRAFQGWEGATPMRWHVDRIATGMRTAP